MINSLVWLGFGHSLTDYIKEWHEVAKDTAEPEAAISRVADQIRVEKREQRE